MWTYNLVTTVIEDMKENWVHHILAAEAMLAYVRSAGCNNYQRLAAFYVHHMKGLDPVTMKKLQYGAFVRHMPCIYNSTWTDMFLETTYKCMWHGQTLAIGLAIGYHQLAKWALICNLSGEVLNSVRSLSNTEQNSHHTRHRKQLRVETRQTTLTARACATHLMFALTHWIMHLTRWCTHEHFPRANRAP